MLLRLTMMEGCPGEGYSMFLSSSSPIDFTYPMIDGQARSAMYGYWEEYNQNALTEAYADLVVPTGISYPIIITDINGDVSVGDELVAYAGGQIVGATRIADLTAPIVISAWGGYHEFGIDLEGYETGDAIDLRLYSAQTGDEMKVNINLDNNVALVKGVDSLKGAPVMSTDIRASASLILASLSAKGKSEIYRIYHLDRGYESIDNKLKDIGGRIWRQEE